MEVKIHSADRIIIETESPEIILPGADGELAVMDFHQPCIYALRAGKITVKYKNEKTEKRKNIKRQDVFVIKKGVAKIVANELVILVET